MSKYLNGELIRVEPGREGSPVCHVVWDSYAQREVRIYPNDLKADLLDLQQAALDVREEMLILGAEEDEDATRRFNMLSADERLRLLAAIEPLGGDE